MILSNTLGSHHGRNDLDSMGAYIPDVASPLTVAAAKHGGASGGNDSYPHNHIANFSGVRRLTPVECERLQGFPDNWTFGSDSTRYRQLGNAVCRNVAEWIGLRLREAIEKGA